ncbi:PHB depolymerase family esterase (plasmid) [Rhizobium sp. B230/85]|uniref:extracellular catalytic domain type 1 short-chain-length polyhydroxyalkanoate depolymerase n=1 Tax=unclassified Rhizobium TaxID=2613769 RepID=UPI001ADB9201|nr:PHB depolymerase family esterase [Rhizobium sp. B209b/85]QXZ99552.1 PHB depolymerase family esterase [Rhizobium sp. B230/85]
MRPLSDTIRPLRRYQASLMSSKPIATTLKKLESFGSNPGELQGWYQMPQKAHAAPALVVGLHACLQTAADYDHGSGWSELARRYGFAVLFPEQCSSNNATLCFNWFNPEDVTRDSGEVLSIRQMIASLITNHEVDAARVYVVGLSAGGAMANALLATYPEVFAGGAIISGLPYGVASTLLEAFDRMRGHELPSALALEASIRAASSHQGPWPTLSVWHGTSDDTVVDANSFAIVEQWRNILEAEATTATEVEGHRRRSWLDASGRRVIDHYHIIGMGHGFPTETKSGYGQRAPLMLEMGISATAHIAWSWCLMTSFTPQTTVAKAEVVVIPQDGRTPPREYAIVNIFKRVLRAVGLIA